MDSGCDSVGGAKETGGFNSIMTVFIMSTVLTEQRKTEKKYAGMAQLKQTDVKN